VRPALIINPKTLNEKFHALLHPAKDVPSPGAAAAADAQAVPAAPVDHIR
jgi:hypothetical protein